MLLADWYRPGVVLDYPVGGSGALVDALVRGLERHSGRLMLGAHVEQVLVEGNHAIGVRLRGGREVRARRAVVANASVWVRIIVLWGLDIPWHWSTSSRCKWDDCREYACTCAKAFRNAE